MSGLLLCNIKDNTDYNEYKLLEEEALARLCDTDAMSETTTDHEES